VFSDFISEYLYAVSDLGQPSSVREQLNKIIKTLFSPVLADMQFVVLKN
jgi:hypothetical protein